MVWWLSASLSKMTSKISSSNSGSRPSSRVGAAKDVQMNDGQEEASQIASNTLIVIESLRKTVAADRIIHVKRKIEENKQKLKVFTDRIHNLSKSRKLPMVNAVDSNTDLLTKRLEDAMCMLSGLDLSAGEREQSLCVEESPNASPAIVFGSNSSGKNVFRPIKLPEEQKIPPYTTWMFLDRNQRMTEDQSVVGRRRIYYDQSGGEALICSDSEEDTIDEEDDKKEFGDCEDYILRKTIEEVGLSDTVLDILAQQFQTNAREIKVLSNCRVMINFKIQFLQARYELLLNQDKSKQYTSEELNAQREDALAGKDLDAALDSFDNLFCRRCLVFDCRLHGCSQDLVLPAEKHPPWSNTNDDEPCGTHCYRLALQSGTNGTASASVVVLDEKPVPSFFSADGQMSFQKISGGSSATRRLKSRQTDTASSTAKHLLASSSLEAWSRKTNTLLNHSGSPLKAKQVGIYGGTCKRNNKRAAERVLVCIRKKQKKMAVSDSNTGVSGSLWPRDMKLRSNSRKEISDATSSTQRLFSKSPKSRKSRKQSSPIPYDANLVDENVDDEVKDSMDKESKMHSGQEISRDDSCANANVLKCEVSKDNAWKTIEKSLFAKGVEIFGRNSCHIARNVLNGMKTCAEIAQYMNFNEMKPYLGAGEGANCHNDACGMADCDDILGTKLRRRSRFLRRRGRVRRLKYTWKSAGHPAIRKRIADRKDQPCRQFTPCSCQSSCGKQCSCLQNGTCCEKYCGCPKTCKNRFRGCHCAKSQCRSRQCPCFAADRECDPDVCRNCWVGCGDGTMGGPNQRGDNYECRNMKLLLKQQQRVLLGRSDVSGWGAFLKNSVNKHEYLGEYTGELISHREADKRGKIYDRENSSFLFNLNDQFVLDAYRKGDKLKFANHSPDPNCYAKVIMVAGDHRVGIFAKERICAGEELFYDYRYEPDRAPAWARKPEASSSRKDELTSTHGRAKKLA
ncbi:hypothetical protein AMTRI_Chr13g121590 [Amborella trichopoda]